MKEFVDSPYSILFWRSSSGFGDELAWAAVWLYRATQNVTYLNDAKAFYNQFGLSGAGEFSWDNKAAGVQVYNNITHMRFTS